VGLSIRGIKSVLRKVLLWETLLKPAKPAYRFASTFLLLRSFLLRNSIGMKASGSSVVFSKGERKILAPSSLIIDEKICIARDFEKLFTFISSQDGTIDFTGCVSLAGMSVHTTPGMALEFPDMAATYHRYYAPKKGGTVLDCGSFHGLYAIAASSLVGATGKVYCFEPDKGNAAVLRDNLNRNGISNAVIVEKGIWDKDGTAKMRQEGLATSSMDFSGASSNSFSIDVTSLPSFIESNGISGDIFVKMDIEGAEIEAVRGCINYMKGHALNFAIASYHLRDGAETFHALEPMFSEAGYWHKTEKGETITTYAQPNRSAPSKGRT